MDAGTPVIRWRRASGRGYSLWHLETPTFSDTHGRTGCGKRYRRADAEHGDIADGPLCRGCLRALAGAVPGEPEPGA